MIVEIKDLERPELDVYARLTEHQRRARRNPAEAVILAESAKVVKSALDAGLRPISFLMERRHITGDGAALLARCPEVPVYTGDGALLARLTGYSLHRGLLCAMARPAEMTAEAALEGASRVALLEGITDGTNVGAIFRSAAALGMDAVLLDGTCCDPLGRRPIRVSMGTVFSMPWARIDTTRAALELLHRRGFLTAALALSDQAAVIDDPRLQRAERLALLLGTEGTGLRPETVAGCRMTAMIPMQRGVDSLNVGAAAAVAFWQVRKLP